MRKVLLFLFAILLILPLCACTGDQEGAADPAPTVLHRVITSGKLRVVTCADFAPVVYAAPDGTIKGSDIRLCEYLADRLEVDLEVSHANLADFSTLLSQGEADLALGGIGPTDTRKLTMLVSDPYYSRTEPDHILLTQSYRAQDLDTPEDFRDLIIGAQKGSLQYDLVCDQLPGAQIILFSNLEEGKSLLLDNTVDVLATSGIIAREMNADLFSAAAFTLTDETQSYIIAAALEEEEWMAEINRMLETVREQDLYATWLQEETALTEDAE